MFWTDYLREVAAEFRRLGQRNRRLYAGIMVVLALLAWIICWQLIALLASLFSDAGPSISGVVRHKGRLLEQGRISFHAKDANLDQKPLAGAVIIAGRYKVPPSPALKPGESYVVRIWSPRAVPHGGLTTPAAEESIPPKFNDDSTKKITIRRFGWNTCDVDVE